MNGRVMLIGAGCGKGLITVKALKALKKAEVVVYDDLIDDGLLDTLSPSCRRIYVGKRYDRHSRSQGEINGILIEEAKKGKLVARLKGGDSFVFGRGGEEYLALSEEGIPCDVFPGISSAIAVPESMGIPVTHRGVAQSFTVITGHTAGYKTENYEALAALSGTLVFLMGIRSIREIAERLMRYGKDGKTPASVLCRGFSGRGYRIDGCLSDIGDKADSAQTPGILVVGDAASFHMESSRDLPLSGERIAITGTASFTERLSEMLEELGAFVETLVCLKIKPMPENIPETFEGYDRIAFTSANGIEVFFEEQKRRRTDIRTLAGLRFACIGSGTAAKLAEYGIYADLIPREYTAVSLGKALADAASDTSGTASDTSGKRILILRAVNGSPELNRELERKNVAFDDVKIYDAVKTADTVSAERLADCHFVVFASAAGARAFFESHELHDAKVICIGDVTADEIRKHTDRQFFTAEEHSVRGIAELLCRLAHDDSDESRR